MGKNYIHETIHSASDRTPYTYLIGWEKLDIWYYGVRFAKGCHPSDLWVKYFTSSRIVKKFAEDNGPPDVITVDKIFNSINDARLYEHSELTRLNAISNNKFLNKSAGLGIPPMPGKLNPFFGKTHTEETRIKISKANAGKIHTEEFRRNLRENYSGVNHSRYGKKHTDETIDKMRKIKKGKKVPSITLLATNPFAYSVLTNNTLLNEYKNQGKSSNSIAIELGINSTTVRRYAKKFNIDFDSHTEHPIKDDVIVKLKDRDYLIDCIKNGKTAAIIANELDVSPASVLRYAKIIHVKFPRKAKNMKISDKSMRNLLDKSFFIDCKNKNLTFNDISKFLGDVTSRKVGYHYRKLFNTRY